jgi:hypothetical protein
MALVLTGAEKELEQPEPATLAEKQAASKLRLNKPVTEDGRR